MNPAAVTWLPSDWAFLPKSTGQRANLLRQELKSAIRLKLIPVFLLIDRFGHGAEML